MGILVRLVLNGKFLEIISKLCGTLCVIGCIIQEMMRVYCIVLYDIQNNV